MARYLLTGAAGFIASKIAELLLDDGHTVVGVDNLNDAYDVRLKQWRLTQLQSHPKYHFHQFDITNRQRLRGLFDGHDSTRDPQYNAVLNLAARAGVRQSVQNPWVYFDTNVTGTLNLLELCREFRVEKFVLASSSSLYGARSPVPFREDADTDHPMSPYAASKKAAELLSFTYHCLHGLDITVLRYFTVYGPAGRPDMSLFRFVQWISEDRPVLVYGDGTQSRDFTYVDDIARGSIAALDPNGLAGQPGYEVINLGSDEPVVLKDAIRLVEDLVGKRASLRHKPRHPADVLATWADISKAGSILGWRPRVRFEDGVARLVDWYRQNQAWAKEIRTT